MKKIIKPTSFYLLVLLTIFLNVSSTLKCIFDFSSLYISIGIITFGIISLILYILNKIIYKNKSNYILIILLSLFALISYVFAYNKTVALIGSNGRFEGLLMLLSYYSIYLLSTTLDKDKQHKILSLVLFFGFYQIILGTIQILRIENIFGYDRSYNWSAHYKFASGTFANPNFYSTYILMCLSYSFGNLLLNKKEKIKYLIYTFIFGYGLVIGNTQSCLLAFILLLIYTFIKRINKNNYKKVLASSVIFIVIILIFNTFVNNRITYTIKKDITSLTNINSKEKIESLGNGRVYVWEHSLKQANILTGIGIDNFSFINNGSYICYLINDEYECFDKAHNEYLQIFITEGIFALITYLLLIRLTIRKNRNIVNSHHYGIYLAFITYLIQAFFNISVILVAPIYWIILGFLNDNNNRKEKKNILLLIGYLTNGGAEHSIIKLANELKKKHNVYLVVVSKENQDYESDVPIIEINELGSRKHRYKGIRKLRKIKKKYDIDVSISYTTVFNFYNVITKYKDKTIISIRNHLSTKQEGEIPTRLHKISIRLCNTIVCCSNSVKDDQIVNYHANPKKIRVITNFCDPKVIEEKTKEPFDKELLKKDLIVAVARLVPHKGHNHVIKAMSLVIKKNKNAHLLILGKGKELDNLKELVKQKRLEKYVTFGGFTTNPYKYLNKAKAFVLASDYEGFPNALIEAMFCGTPVIATDAPGGSGEIIDSEYGILIPSFINEHNINDITDNERLLAEHLINLTTDKKLYNHYHQKSLERSNEYTKDKIMKDWYKVIDE